MTQPRSPAETAAYVQGMRDAAAMLDMSNQTIRLRDGEMTPLEMLTVQAILGWKRREMIERANVVAKIPAQPHQDAIR